VRWKRSVLTGASPSSSPPQPASASRQHTNVR